MLVPRALYGDLDSESGLNGRSGCWFVFGRIGTAVYCIQQLVTLGLITLAITDPFTELFSAIVWAILALQMGCNLIIGLNVWCSYQVKQEDWANRKLLLAIILGVQFVIHAGVPALFALLAAFSTDPEQKAYYETMRSIFTIAYSLHFAGCLFMTLPYFLLYSASVSVSVSAAVPSFSGSRFRGHGVPELVPLPYATSFA